MTKRGIQIGKRSIAAICLAGALSLSLLACGSTGSKTEENKSQVKQEDSKSKEDKEKQEKVAETTLMDWNPKDNFGVYFLGCGKSYEELVNSAASDDGKQDGIKLALDYFPEMENIKTVTYDTKAEGDGSFYLVLPHYIGQRFTFTGLELVDGDLAVSKEIPTGEYTADGNPFLVRCNASDIYSDVIIQATVPDGTVYGPSKKTATFAPYESLRDGHITNEVFKDSKYETSEEGVRLLRLAPLDQNELNEVLNACIGYSGTAGGSLKVVSGTANLMYYSRNNVVDRMEDGALLNYVQTWYDGLSEDQKEDFKSSRTEVSSTGDSILSKDASLQGSIQASGVEDIVTELLNLGDSKSSWESMKTALTDVE